MGYPYNELIAPAILFANPGITRQEFVRLLDETHSSCIHEYKFEEPWESYSHEDERYHRSLKGLAGLLGLEYSRKFEEFQQPKPDGNGLWIRAPYAFPARKEDEHLFEVIVHERNVFEEPKKEESCAWDKLKVGDVWEEPQMGCERGIVLEILKETKYRRKRDNWDETCPRYFYKMTIRPFHSEGRMETFKSEQELYEKWPQFHPDFVYEWSQRTGHFRTIAFGRENFLWMQENGKYSLNPQTFDRIPASWGCSGNLGYTDLILTSQAINYKAWKLLSYKGLQHFPQFLKDFPEVVHEYGRAIWDSHTSLSAKMQGLTISDFLRFRAPGN